MPVTRTLPQIPSPDTPLLADDGKTMRKEWFDFLNALRAVLEVMRVAIP